MLSDGFHPVPAGKIAAVVTHLEMTDPPPARPASLPPGCELRRVPSPQPDWYRSLFTRVGANDWLWFSRLRMSPEELAAILTDPGVEVFALMNGDTAEGLLELDFRGGESCKLAFLGLTSDLQGKGAGRAMMNEAIRLAFAKPIDRLTIHTCTFDSPAALPFYLRSGFVPVRREIEVVDDPRLAGTLPPGSAPHVPVIAR